MHASQIIPNRVILLIGHPRPRHKDKEKHIHDEQHDDQSKNLALHTHLQS